MGKATGLVASSRITHATPAAFGAHVIHRDCENLIASNMVSFTQPDIILENGARHFDGTQGMDFCGRLSDNLPAAISSGCGFVTDSSDLLTAIDAGTERIIGLFTSSHMPAHLDLLPGLPYILAEMSTAALEVLEEDKDGFFVMIEGSRIDWAGHANDPAYLTGVR